MLSGQTVYMQIVRRIYELYRSQRLRTNIEVEVHPEVARYLTKQACEKLTKKLGRRITVVVNEQISREAYSLIAVSD